MPQPEPLAAKRKLTPARFRVCWIALAAVSFAGCSTNDTESGVQLPDPAGEIVSREQLFISMAGIATGDQSRIVDVSLLQEEERAKGECMRAAGFEYVDARPSMLMDYAPQSDIHDPEFATQFGFGIAVGSFGGIESNPNDRTIMSLSTAEGERWNQRDQTCSAEARSAIQQRIGDLAPLQRLADEVGQRARTNAEFLRAQSSWKRCMTEAEPSFVGESFDDLFADYLQRYTASPETYDRSAELRAAVASTTCDGNQWEVFRGAVDDALQQVDPSMFASTRDVVGDDSLPDG